MRIAIDATCWANARGYGRFTRELVAAMLPAAPDDEFLCLLDPAARERFTLDAPNVTPVVVPQSAAPTTAASADGARAVSDMLRLTRAVHRLAPDVFFSPSVYTYFPLPPGQRAVVTIHDAIAERFPELTLPTPRARWFWKAKVRLAIHQARLVLTVSDYAARELTEVLDIAAARIRVALEAPADAYRQPTTDAEIADAARAAGIPPGRRWFVYVGGFNPHKLVHVLVRAHARVAAELDPAPHLVLVGTRSGDVFHGGSGAIDRAIADAGTADMVHWPGFVPDDALRPLLAGARALVLASTAEGFGLPAVEAACCGTPVIATTASPLPELLAGGGHFVAPGDEEALVAAMRRLALDDHEHRTMGEIARARARALTWEQGARAALDALREAAA